MNNNELKCRLCRQNSNKQDICKHCAYLIGHGTTEETIKKMIGNDIVNAVWKQNEQIAENLANAYYDFVLEDYKDQMKKDNKENAGYNMFAEGINMALDIIMPLLDDFSQIKVKAKIDSMVKIREKNKAKTNKKCVTS